jgi:hypothetical protein
MDNNEFLQKLSELTEWEIPKVGPGGCSMHRKKAVVEEVELDEDGEEIVFEEPITKGPNTTMAPRIIKIKPQPRMCEDCHEIVDNRVTLRKVNFTPVMHWREKCNCGIHKDPNTGEFSLRTNQELQDAFRKYLQNRLDDK